ncbi:ABC transporter ATP-binding protein [Clostridia bacterium]|nr:ABC transporter ATP-binding protein [Clostridia bacterium]
MLTATKLTKTYSSATVVDNLSISVGAGEIVGLLGPNGAGKTTTLNMLTGYLAPTSGTVTVNGQNARHDPVSAARHIGFLPENPPLYNEMTVRAYLDFVYGLKGVKAANKREHIHIAAQSADVADVMKRVIGNLSRGYRQRVGLAAALIGDPDIVILDEPTVGLDPRQIHDIRNLIQKLGESRAVLLSTHILPEASQLCKRVLVLHHGRVVAYDEPANLKVPKKRDRAARPELLNMMTPKEREIFELGQSQKNLEDVFLSLTLEEKL